MVSATPYGTNNSVISSSLAIAPTLSPSHEVAGVNKHAGQWDSHTLLSGLRFWIDVCCFSSSSWDFLRSYMVTRSNWRGVIHHPKRAFVILFSFVFR